MNITELAYHKNNLGANKVKLDFESTVSVECEHVWDLRMRLLISTHQ